VQARPWESAKKDRLALTIGINSRDVKKLLFYVMFEMFSTCFQLNG
jgi:hypothetical protein